VLQGSDGDGSMVGVEVPFADQVPALEAAGADVHTVTDVDLATADLVDDYPAVELDEVAARSPDLVLVPSEPYAFSDDHLVELRSVVPQATMIRVDGQDLFWWGVRTPDAIERLGAAIARG